MSQVICPQRNRDPCAVVVCTHCVQSSDNAVYSHGNKTKKANGMDTQYFSKHTL